MKKVWALFTMAVAVCSMALTGCRKEAQPAAESAVEPAVESPAAAPASEQPAAQKPKDHPAH
jgi:hypothetical protein